MGNEAHVCGDVEINGVELGDSAHIYGGAIVKSCKVFGSARISGSAYCYNSAIIDRATVKENARVCSSVLYNDAYVYGDADISVIELGDSAHIYGGVWSEKIVPVAIRGTRHHVCEPAPGVIKIGREIHTIGIWKRDFAKIGKANKYTKPQIAEYKAYIDLIDKMQEIRKIPA